MTNYKKKLAEARKLVTTGCLALYDRVSLLIDVFDDRQFRVGEGLDDDHAAADWLTEGYLPDCDWEFLQLRALMKYAPIREQWGEGKLRRLYAEMVESQREPRGETVTRERVTKKDLEIARDEVTHYKSQVLYLRERVEQLETENRQLRADLARADGRIQELERMVRRELVAA